MPRPRITTVYLGQYTRVHANAIAGRLEQADIVWWYKDPGFLSRLWEYGIRMFVDEARLDEARAIADDVLTKMPPADGAAGS
ncbi:MAG TPA: hypothetical protein VGH10_07860 [Actinomycetota bacterium]